MKDLSELDIPFTGIGPKDGILIYINSELKRACLIFEDYKVTYDGSKFTSEKGTCSIEDVYVSDGLIVRLDAINNTGNGHANDITEWVDLSGNGNNATLYNNPTVSNNSIVFDGETNYARIENTSGMEFPNGVTLEARVKVLSFIGTTSNGAIDFFGNWESGGIGLTFSSKNYYFGNFHVNNKWQGPRIPNNSNSILQYYTVTASYNDSSMAKLYIDGQLVNTVSLDEGTIKKSMEPLTLGGNPYVNGAMDSYANVEFQSVRVYNRALTDEEVAQNYQIDNFRY